MDIVVDDNGEPAQLIDLILGAHDLFVGSIKAVEGTAIAFGLSETGIGEIAGGYLTLNGVGQAAAGGELIYGSLVGNTQSGEAAANFFSSISSGPGARTLVLSRGDVNQAALSAAGEGFLSPATATALLTKGTITTDQFRQLISIIQKVKGALNAPNKKNQPARKAQNQQHSPTVRQPPGPNQQITYEEFLYWENQQVPQPPSKKKCHGDC
jgi:hypothetical protein